MNVIRSLAIAFSMYSKIPVPRVTWKEEAMRYAMCFLPCVGAVVGLLVYGFGWLGTRLCLGVNLYAAFLVAIPVLVTGGIHLDGYLDTVDAISSYQPMERRLEILKDSNSGAFAIIFGIVYFLLAFGLWSQVSMDGIRLLAVGFVLSRAFSGLAVVSFPCAKQSGLAALFARNAQKNVVRVVMTVYILACLGLLVWLGGFAGLVSFLAALLVFGYYHHMAMSKFGGITGDLAGFFLQVCELSMAAAVVICEIVGGVL